MVRFNIILAGILLVATSAVGRPASIPKPPSAPSRAMASHALLDLAHLQLFHLFHQAEASEPAAAQPSADPGKDWSRQSDLPDLSMGPLHPEFGHDDNPYSGLSNSELPDQLGSSVWKDLQNKSHSAKLMFIWPTDK